MGYYFKPLRRKFGIITLFAACVVLAAWVRSLTIADEIYLGSCWPSDVVVSNACQCIEWVDISDQRPRRTKSWPKPMWVTFPAEQVEDRYNADQVANIQQWMLIRSRGIVVRVSSHPEVMIPHWVIDLPLTLLSVYLLLSKVRSATPASTLT